MSTVTEKLGSINLENEDFEHIVKTIEKICSTTDLYKKETDDVPEKIKKYGMTKAVKIVLDDLDSNWINTITLYIFDWYKNNVHFGACFFSPLSNIQDGKMNAVIGLPMLYPDYKNFEDIYKDKIKDINKKYDEIVDRFKKLLNISIPHELRHAFDYWSKKTEIYSLESDNTILKRFIEIYDNTSFQRVESIIAHLLKDADKEILKDDPNWKFPSDNIKNMIQRHNIVSISDYTNSTYGNEYLGFFQVNMYYLENLEINAFFESFISEIKRFYKSELFYFSVIDDIKKIMDCIDMEKYKLDDLSKYKKLYSQLKNFIRYASPEVYSRIMGLNAKIMAMLMMKFKYPKMSCNDPKYSIQMDKEIKSGQLLKEYLEYKIDYLRNKFSKLASIIYDFCQKAHDSNELFYMYVDITFDYQNKNKDTYRLKGTGIQLLKAYYILHGWLGDYNVSISYKDEPSIDNNKVITYILLRKIINDYKPQERNYFYKLSDSYRNLWNKNIETIKKRLNNIKVNSDNFQKLLELFFKQMKVEYEKIDKFS